MRNEFTSIINEKQLYNKIDSIIWQLIKYTTVFNTPFNNISGYIYECLLEHNQLQQLQLQSQSQEIPLTEKQIQDIISERTLTITSSRENLYKLLKLPQVAQRSPEWYELRKNRLTASAVAQAIGKGKFSSKAELLKDKAFPELAKPFDSYSSPPLRHGIILEDMTARCYSQRLNNIKIHNFGMIPHETLTCFGASPDGINELGIMVEIKTPYRRRVDGNIPYEYMVQMQGQMAVCNLQECDFVDAEIWFNYRSLDDYVNDMNIQDNIYDHGIIVEYHDFSTSSKTHIYSPENLTAKQCIEWANNYKSTIIKEKQSTQDSVILILPWKLNKIMIKRVYFNEEVWNNLVPQIEDFWKEVISTRNAGVDALPKKTKYVRKTSASEPVKIQTAQFIDSDEDM